MEVSARLSVVLASVQASGGRVRERTAPADGAGGARVELPAGAGFPGKQGSSELSSAQQASAGELRRVDLQARDLGSVVLRLAQGVASNEGRYQATYGRDGKQPEFANRAAEAAASDSRVRFDDPRGARGERAGQAVATTVESPLREPPTTGGGEAVARGQVDGLVATPQSNREVSSPLRVRSAEASNGDARDTQRSGAIRNQAERTGEAQNTEASGPAMGRIDVMRQRLALAYQNVSVATTGSLSLRA